MPSSKSHHHVIICAMFALSPLAPVSAMAGASWRAGGPRLLEVRPETPQEAGARAARLARTEQVGWELTAATMPCDVFEGDGLCTRLEVTTSTGRPVRGLVGTATLGFAADARTKPAGQIFEHAPGVYLSSTSPDRLGIWDVRLIVGARIDAPLAFELTERFEL